MMRSDYSAVNIIAYLSLCFSIIAILVFLNATQPFVLTDLLGVVDNVGKKSGTLGFLDEIVSMVLAPLWGALSDEIGTRPVATIGVVIMSLAIAVYTSATSVFPGLAVYRMLFAVGGSASISMLTAILAELSHIDPTSWFRRQQPPRLLDNDYEDGQYTTLIQPSSVPHNAEERRNGRFAGLVGTAAGFGALAAASLLLPLPTRIDSDDPAHGIRVAYYIVAGLGFGVALLALIGLHRDRTKSVLWLFGKKVEPSVLDEAALDLPPQPSTPYLTLIKLGFTVASEDRRVALAYYGSFVARAAAMSNTLFIPLSVKARGIEGHDAYIQAAILAGISNSFVLVFAPIFGISADKYGRSRSMILGAVCGFIGTLGFGLENDPRSVAAYVTAAFMGIGQVAATITSLSLCTDTKRSYSGAIAGVYSFFGGSGVLIVSLVGGFLVDIYAGLSFMMLAGFYAILAVAATWNYKTQAKEIIFNFP